MWSTKILRIYLNARYKKGSVSMISDGAKYSSPRALANIMAIPTTPPSINLFGNKKILMATAARSAPKQIYK